ncbi:hypothetical protein FQA39_LY18108 [Lamprigera yunnana]|nr:hypothetical protein FQA39_LY18108 [Lamprigera yunnana]
MRPVWGAGNVKIIIRQESTPKLEVHETIQEVLRPRELDLDFLERRQNAGPSSDVAENPKSPVEVSPESVDRFKVIVLGAPAVGKTSIIQIQAVSVLAVINKSVP